MGELNRLALRYGTDKSSAGHGYADVYDAYFLPVKAQQTEVNLLELGYGGHENPLAGGESARMWREYLPQGTITVIDNQHKINPPMGVNVLKGSQDDPEFLNKVHDAYGDWDIIIDDASHVSSLTIASFKILWPMLKPGGFYCVEDTHSSYHAWYYGDQEANPDPGMQDYTWMGFANRLIHETHGGLLDPEYRMGYSIEYVHQYRDLTIIQKSG